MFYKTELEYLLRVMKKMHLQARIVSEDTPADYRADMGIRHYLGLDMDLRQPFLSSLRTIEENTIYRVMDGFGCNYLFLLLPGLSKTQGLVVGPYTAEPVTQEDILELAEHFAVPAAHVRRLENCFEDIPVIRDQTALIAMFTSLGEVLWGGDDAFEIVELVQSSADHSAALRDRSAGDDPEDVLYRMKMMESRYAYENELMDMVAQGRYHRAEAMLNSFSDLVFEKRAADPVRNIKNYGVICNTLMRKAAERGGVHPVYLDSTSSEYARKIESITSMEGGKAMIGKMVHDYCRLVRKHISGNFSAPVQKTMAYIETDLSGDLSLRALAGVQNLSAGYLSSLFRKETGQTLTEYVNQKRVDEGARLLHTTCLQVQTIAQHCGMSDVNYFSKLFKKRYGLTPREFREKAAAGYKLSMEGR